MWCRRPIKHPATGQKPGRVLLQLSPLKKPLAAESYFAAVGIFCPCPAHTLQAILRHRKEAGKRVLCSQGSWKAASPKILLRHGKIFLACPLLPPYKAPLPRKEASSGKRQKHKKILLRCRRNFCPCAAQALQAIPHHRKEAGTRVLCSQAPKKPLAAKSYYGAVGISLVGLACHNDCPYLQAPPS